MSTKYICRDLAGWALKVELPSDGSTPSVQQVKNKDATKFDYASACSIALATVGISGDWEPVEVPDSPAVQNPAKPSTWINIASGRLPDGDETVLVFVPESDETIQTGYYDSLTRKWSAAKRNYQPLDGEPTHWQKLPDPPERE